MAKLINWILEAFEEDEVVEAVVVGEWKGLGDDRIPEDKKGIVLSWDEAKKLLDYEFSDGYGLPDCHPIYVWTNRKVMWISTYDGSTWLSSMPRNPQPCMPKLSGGY